MKHFSDDELKEALQETEPPPERHVLDPDGHYVPFHRGQEEVWDSTRRITAMSAGTQSGKTCLGPWWLKRKIDEGGSGDYYAITATYDLFNLKMLPELLRVFRGKLECGRYWGGNTRVLEISDPDTGEFWAKRSTDPMWARVILRSADSKGGLESGTAKAAWLDEAGQDRFTLAAWRAVRRRLSLHQGDVLITTTLFNLGWLKQQIIDPAKEDGTTELTVLPRGGAEIEVTDSPTHNVRLIQFDSIVNPVFPIEEYEEARRTMPTDEFAMFYRGRVAKLRTLIYDVFDETIGVNVVNSFPIPAHWPKSVGIDPIGAQIGALWIALDPDLPQVHVYREYLAPFGETTAGHAENILEASTGEQIDIWAGGGPSERQARTDWTAAGIALVDPPNIPVWSGIERVYSLVKPRSLVVHKCCEHLLSEIGSYQRMRDRSGNLTDQIKDKEQFHLLDCLRYIIATVTEPYPDGGVKYADFPSVRIGY